MSDNNRINNFAGDGFREAEIVRDKLGPNSISRAIIQGANGELLYENRGGMARVTPIVKTSTDCLDVVSPLTQVEEGNAYWTPGEGEEPNRIWSVDGLLSIPKSIAKTVPMKESSSSANTVNFRLASDDKDAVTRPGDFIEYSRTFATDGIPAWFSNGLLFGSSKCVASITFNRGTCPVTLKFNQFSSTVGDDARVTGSYVMANTTPIPMGADTITMLCGERQLTMNFSDVFLERFPYSVASSLRDGKLVPALSDASKLPGAFFWFNLFGSPFKFFAHSSGLFLDEYRAVQITNPDPGTVSVSPDEDTPARYFNFSTNGDYHFDKLDCYLRNDIQFNSGASYPGTASISLGNEEHLYKDPDGSVWRISFALSAIDDYNVTVTASLAGRVDCFLDDAKNAVVKRVILAEDFTQQVPSNYLKAKGFAGIIIDSLPNGTQASIAINSPRDTSVNPIREPESVIILKCHFSGTGGKTGSGISMYFEQIPTVTTYTTTSDNQPGVTWNAQNSNMMDNQVNLTCNYSSKSWNPNTQSYDWVPSSVTIIPNTHSYSDVEGGVAISIHSPGSYFYTDYEQPYKYTSKYTFIFNANIQLVARADNSWDMVKMEYTHTSNQHRDDDAINNFVHNINYYCAALKKPFFDTDYNQGEWPWARSDGTSGGYYKSLAEEMYRHDITYSCGEQKITGFLEQHNVSRIVNSEWSGDYDFAPYDTPYPIVHNVVDRVGGSKSSLEAPWFKQEYSSLQTTQRVTSGSGDNEPLTTFSDSGVVVSGTAPTVIYMKIVTTHEAKNVHEVEYDYSGTVPNRTNKEQLIHGIKVTRPMSGKTACDDPRNSRVVLMDDADAGCFY